jgi:hypothetical protein
MLALLVLTTTTSSYLPFCTRLKASLLFYAYSLGASIRQHRPAYASIRQHKSAYVSIRQHTAASGSIRQHTSPICTRLKASLLLYAYSLGASATALRYSLTHTSAYVSIRQHTSAYVRIRQHTSAYVTIRQHTSAYGSIR